MARVPVYYTYQVEKDIEYRATLKSRPFETPAVATIAKNDHRAAPGMTVVVRLETKDEIAGLLLPQQAFFYQGGKLAVYIVNERNVVQPRAVPAEWGKSGIVGVNWRSNRGGGVGYDAPCVTGEDLVVADASLVKPGMVIRPDLIAGALQGPAAAIEFEAKPLTDAVKYLEDAHHIQIRIDEPGLAAAGIKPDVACTMYLHEVPLATALRLLLQSVGLTYVAKDDYILITVPGKEGSRDVFNAKEGAPMPAQGSPDEDRYDPGTPSAGVPQPIPTVRVAQPVVCNVSDYEDYTGWIERNTYVDIKTPGKGVPVCQFRARHDGQERRLACGDCLER